MQFTAVMLLSLMTLALVTLLPRRVAEDAAVNRSRWLMVAGLGLLAVQFLLQHVWHFRSMGVTQAVMVNLLFFIPCSALLSLSVLNLQRQGEVRRIEWLIAIPTWLIAMGIIAWGSHHRRRTVVGIVGTTAVMRGGGKWCLCRYTTVLYGEAHP